MTTLSPPMSPVRHHDRPHARTSNSFMSSRSRRSSGSNKMDLTESPRDKKRLNTKADPSMALSEAQPAAVALEKSTLEDVRSMQYKDSDGNYITDPDKSNPTRHRLERPLDTIRAFNAAAEGTTTRRASYGPRPSPGSAYGGQDHRRSGHFGNGNPPPQQRARPGTGGYYRNSSYGFRPESYAEEPAPMPPQPPYGRPPRQQSQPYYGNGESSSPGHSYQQSYETMTSGSDDYGKSTNPSSQNSSFDRLHQMHSRKPDEYGHYDNEIQPAPPAHNGYGQHPGHPGQNRGYGQPQYSNGSMPGPNPSRQPIQLTTANSGPPPTRADLNKELPQKRQSWFRRKLSRRDS